VADPLNSLFPSGDRYTRASRRREVCTRDRRPTRAVDDAGIPRRAQTVRTPAFGIGVTDASRRQPAVTAQAAATLNLITRGRAILGLGVGEREGNQPYGVDWTTPVARFDEQSPPSGHCGAGAANSSRVIRPISPYATRLSRFPLIADGGQKSGSPRANHGCSAPRAATPTRGSPACSRSPTTTPPDSIRYAQLHPTLDATQQPSCRRYRYSSSPAEPTTPSNRP
jgi:hypothetical protein